MVRIMVKSKNRLGVPKNPRKPGLLSVLTAKYTLVEGYLYGIMKETREQGNPTVPSGIQTRKANGTEHDGPLKKMIEEAKEEKNAGHTNNRPEEGLRHGKEGKGLRSPTVRHNGTQARPKTCTGNITTGMKMRLGDRTGGKK